MTDNTKYKDIAPQRLNDSKIEKLIAELCPEGVEYRELQELFVTKNGYTPLTTNKAYWTDGKIPWFRMEDIRANGRILSESLQQITEEAVKGGRLFPANSIIVATSATIGEHALITVPHLSNQRFTSLALKPDYENRLDMKFVFYYCFVLGEWCSKNTTTSSFASVDMNGFKKFQIPIPPLAIQQEIVKILDTFTTLEAELEAELKAELKARKKQYEYYRDELLTFGEDVEWKTLGEVAAIYDGTHQTPKYTNEGVKFVSVENIKSPYQSSKYISKSDYDTIYKVKPQIDDVFMTRIGSIGVCAVVDREEELAFYVTLTLIRPNQSEIGSKFLRYIIESGIGKKELRKRTLVNATPIKINLGEIGKIIIPIPPLTEQERIVAILDKFDALVNDISVGLPAELKARRKQYEYYRNKLLTFKKFPSPGGVAAKG